MSRFFQLVIQLVVVVSACFTLPAFAQYAPGVGGQNGIFYVPMTTIGERGRLALTFGGVYGTKADTGGLISFTASLNLFRNLGIAGGITFDSRPGQAAMRQQTFLGARMLLFNWLQRTWFNVGAEAVVVQDRLMDSAGVPRFFGNARVLGTLAPLSWMWFTGYVGYAMQDGQVKGLASAPRTLVRGGGISLRVLPFASVLAEYSNGSNPFDAAQNMAIGGVRLFPSSSISVTVGYGRRMSSGVAQEPVIVGSFALGGGAFDYLGVQRTGFAIAPDEVYAHAAAVRASRDTALSIPVSFSEFSSLVQSDPNIERLLAAVRPRNAGRIFEALDSADLRSEITRLNGDSTRILQITGMESASTEGDSVRVAARAEIFAIAQDNGFGMSRIVLRDQYVSRRTTIPPAYAFCESRKRSDNFEEIVRVDVGRTEEALDSISAILSKPSEARKARIMVLAQSGTVTVLKAAYALQDMLYAQSLFPSYAIDIVFRKVDFGDPMLIVQTAP